MSSHEFGQLLRRLKDVQRLRATRYKIIFLCTAIGLFGSLFIAFSLVDIALKLPLAPRALASSVCLVAMVLAIAKLIQVGLSQRRALRGAARDVERTYPQVETALSTSVEFGEDRERTERLSSEGIVAALVEDTRGRTSALNFFKSINWRRAKAAALWFLVVAAVCGFYAIKHTRLARLTFLRMVEPWKDIPAPTLTMADVSPGNCAVRKLGDVKISACLSGRIPPECRLVHRPLEDPASPSGKWRDEPMTQQDGQFYTFTFSRLTQSMQFRVLAGDFRSDEYTIDVYEVPRVVRINMSLIYPEYCGLGRKELKDSIGPITALRGTVVRIHAFANKPLRRAGIRFRSGEPRFVAATMPKDDELAAEFTIHQNDRYKIWLADAKGRVNEDAVFYTIKALEDKKPVVKFKRPKKDIKAKKTTEVLVEVDTADDYGIREVGIAYKIKTDDLARVPLDEFRERIKKARSNDTLYLEDMELADTDIVTYYAYAEDNDTVAGPKLGTSDLHFIEITPYAYRYMKDEKKAGGGKKDEKKGQKLIEKLEDIIKAQKDLLSKTFRLDKSLPVRLTPAQATQVEDLASTQEALHKKTDQLARRLIENLMKMGLEEHIDRAEHLVRGSNEMGIAAYVLTKGSTATALRYENTALYHLYRAKRDLVKLIQETKDPKLREKLEQAFSSAGKQQQQDEDQELEKEMEELRNQAKDIEQMRDKQQELNKQMQEMAAKKLRKERGDSKAQQNAAPTTKPGDVASKQKALAKQAEKKTLELREMDQQSDKLSAAPARDMDQAAYEMEKAAKAAKERKAEEGKDRGRKADELMKRAEREIKRAMERSLAQQLKDAAAQTKELADRQKALGQETQRQAQAQPDAQPPQQQAQQAKAPDAQKQTQDQAQAGAKGQKPEQAGTAQANAQQKANEEAKRRLQREQLAGKQDEIRRDLNAVGKKLERLGTQVERTEPEIGREVQKLGQDAQAGKAQDEMQKARRELANKRLEAARGPQRQAEKRLDTLAKKVREAADQFAMDDEERLAKAIEKAEKLAEKQGQINKDMGRVQQYHPTGRKPHEDKAARQQEGVRQETQTLAKQVDRIQALQEAGMDEQIREAVEKAADLMDGAKQQLQRHDPQAAERKGIEARKELEQSAKAMRRQMKEALNQKLAKAVEAAKKAHDTQVSAKDETHKAAEHQAKSRKPSRPSSRDAAKPTQAAPERQAAQKATEDQASAKGQTQQLQNQLDDIGRQAKKTHPDLAKDVDKIAREMAAKQPVRRMTQAQRDLERRQYRPAQQHQDAAAKALAQAHGKLDDLYQDSASKPLQTLKAARREAEELRKEVKQLQQKTSQMASRVRPTPAAKPSPRDTQAEKELENLRQQQTAAKERTERFTDRMERLNPTTKDKEKLTELKGKMAEVSSQLGERKLKQASAGLGTSQKTIQDIGKGIIERIKRIADERQRKEPSEENAPDQYRELVKRYYEALSAK